MRYNLEFRKFTLYGITRPQSIRKTETNLWANDLSSLQDLEFNPNFAKNRDILVVKKLIAWHGPSRQCYRKIRFLKTIHLKAD